MRVVTVAERLAELAAEHGSLRAAERALGFNRCYVSRVANGHQREALGPETLQKLGLRVVYVVDEPQERREEPARPEIRTRWVCGPYMRQGEGR